MGLRAELDDAFSELETYDEQLAAAELRVLELEAQLRTGPRSTVTPEPATLTLPRRIEHLQIIPTRRFLKELEAVPQYLRPFVAARLRLLLSHPDALEHRTFPVDESDRTAYRLPKREGLRKVRVNVKYRMFLAAGKEAVEFVSIANHA